MGAVLGATLVGIDKSRQEHDYVAMCEAWFNTQNGMNLVLNRQQDGTGGSFWYELFPHIVFYALADRYPDKPRLAEIMRITADRWRQVCLDLADANGVPDFNHLSFDFRTRKPVDNGKWREPDAAAAVAWLEYAAWKKFRDAKHLAAAESCLKFLQAQNANPYYEVLLPFGALTAARLNAELGRDYDVDRLAQLVLRHQRHARRLGRDRGQLGRLRLRRPAGQHRQPGRLRLRDEHLCPGRRAGAAGALRPALRPRHRQMDAQPRQLRAAVLSRAPCRRATRPARSGRATRSTSSPTRGCATSGWGRARARRAIPVAMNWGPKTDLGLYGSSYVGMLGAIVRPTNEPRILQLDCLATDFFRDQAWPTFLYYNPHPEPRTVLLPLDDQPACVYDAVAKRFVAERARQTVHIPVPADGAALVVVAPADGRGASRRPKAACQ